jgi:alcohol dehydrogenase class IV
MWEVVVNERVFFGAKKIKEAAVIFKSKGLRKVFIAVYDEKALILEEIFKDLHAEGIEYCVYDKVKTEPDLHVINNGCRMFLEEKCDCILAIGGGSVLDAAKAIGMLSANGGLVEEYQMNGKPVVNPSPTLIAIPTTSGTGSEATKVSVVYNNYNGLKKSVYHINMLADVVILDPEVTAGLPKKLTASTGMDALSHAIESYVSLNANAYTEMYSLKAMELINRSFEKAANDGSDLNARGDMALGSYFAGCALNAGIGIAHIIAQPLGATFKIPHGDACSIFLPLAMELNLDYSPNKYKRIAEALGINTSGMDCKAAGKLGIARVKEIRAAVGGVEYINSYMDINKINMKDVVENIRNSTGHIKCNPRIADENLYIEIINMAFGK